MSEAAERSPTIGDNNPPTDEGILRDFLEREHQELIDRHQALMDADVPVVCEDDETAGKMGDFVKQLQAYNKHSEAARKSAKEPHLQAGRIVDGFFKGYSDKIATIKKNVEGSLGVWLREKAAEEKRKRDEEERLAREEADRLAKEAAEKEAAVEEAEDLDEAIDVAGQADTAAAEADKATAAAEAKPAEMARTRGELGSVGTLHTTWKHRNLERKVLDLELLRQHLPEAALDQAVRSYIKAGGREIAGAEIYEHQEARVS